MTRQHYGNSHAVGCIALAVALCLSLALPTSAAVRTSFGVVAGTGLPTGWWADRWGAFQTGEINLRYELSPGNGILFLAGLNKTYLADLSNDLIISDSQLREVKPEFRDDWEIVTAEQGGSLHLVPVGAGFYFERVVGLFRGYGSLAGMIYNWQIKRGQELEVNINTPIGEPSQLEDPWFVTEEGSNLGVQTSVGLIARMRPNTFVDVSLNYSYMFIARENAALLYWGFPTRTWDEERISGLETGLGYLQLRLGVRFGR